MSNRRSFGTLFWALVLVAAGGLLLARNLGYSVQIWQSVAVYWPVLLIGWGLVKVVDYFRLKRAGPNDGRRSLFGAGEVVLLVFVLIAGSIFTTVSNLSTDLGLIGLIGEEFDLFDILGENYEFSSEIAAEIEPGRVVEIRNRYGVVVVEPGDEGRIDVAIEKVVRAASSEAAAELESDLTFSVEEDNGRYVVDSNRSQLQASVRRRYRTNLRIRVPANTALEIDNSYGAVQIAGLTGDQVVENRYGAVTLNRIEGDARISDRYGPVSANEISGSVEVVNRYGAVTLNEVGGNVAVENRYAPVELSGIGGDTAIDNRYATVEVRRATGNVRVGGRNNRVELEDIQGAVDVDASYRNVDARNLMGSVNVVSRHGDVLLRFDEPPSDSITVAGDYSNVRVELPSASVFALEARVRSGTINSDFDNLETETSGRDSSVAGQEGEGGPQVSIGTENGDIRLVRSD